MYIPIFKVISEGKSANSDVVDFESPLFHQEEEHHSAVYDNTDSDNSNGESVEGSRCDLNVNASKMPAGLVTNKEAINSILIGGSVNDGKIDNTKFQSGTVAKLITATTTAPVVSSTEIASTRKSFRTIQ